MLNIYSDHSYRVYDIESGIIISSFRNFHIRKNGKLIRGVKWRTAKAKELFSYLLHKDHYVSKNELTNLFWKDYNQEKALHNLYCTIYQIKELIKSLNLDIEIINTANGYELYLNNIHHDVKVLENTLEIFTEVTDENYLLINKVLNLYTGDYLQDEDYDWKDNRSEQLRMIYISTVHKMMEYYENNEKYMQAIMLGLKSQKLYPYLQSNYLMLMNLYDKVGDYYNVEKQYNLLKNLLHAEYNKVPNQLVRDWYINWKFDRVILHDDE